MNFNYKNLLKNANLIIYLIISFIFLSYFLILNNSMFILLSLIIFIILSFVIVLKDRYLKYVMALSLVFIIISSLLYFKVSFIAIGIALVVFSFYLVFFSHKTAMWLKLMVMLCISIPLIFDAMNVEDLNLFVNLSIIGYYLLISLTIAVIIRVVPSDSTKLKFRRIKNELVSYSSSYNFYILVFLVGIMILILPIYPMRPSFNLNLLPYSTIVTTVPRGYNVSNYTYLILNLSEFKGYGAYNLSSLGFYYDGRFVYAHFYKSNKNLSQVPVILDLPPENRSMKLYFFVPPNVSKSELNLSDFKLPSEPLATKVSTVSNYKYKSNTRNYSVYFKLNETYESNHTLLKYFYPLSLCESDYQNLDSYAIQGNHSFDLFIFKNDSQLNKAIISSNASDYNYSNSTKIFGLYQRSFEKLPISSLNITHYEFNLSSLHEGCINYVILTNRTIKIEDEYNMYHYNVSNVSIKTKVPAYWFINSSFVGPRYSVLPNSLGYLYSEYKEMNSKNNLN